MDYTREFRKFISGQYLSIGVRITATVIIPSIILYRMGLLAHLMAIPMGALSVSMTDNPGPPTHRRNGVIASIILNFLVALITCYTRSYPWLIVMDIVIFGMLFTMLGVYGARSQAVGSIALTIFVFNISSISSSLPGIEAALLFTAGGIWYAIFSSILYTLRPYRILQQKIGECVINTAKYLQIKSNFYSKNPNYHELTDQLINYQVKIHQDHAELREMLFKTRRIINEPTNKSRILMLMFLDSIDLFERIMTSQQDFKELHNELDDTGILEIYQQYIHLLSNQLQEIGIAIQEGTSYKTNIDLKLELRKVKEAYKQLRQTQEQEGSVSHNVNNLYHILHNLGDITERINRLVECTTFDKFISREYRPDIGLDLTEFITHQSYNPRLLWDNLSLKSSTFRHAFRLTIALLIGYAVSWYFPVGHGYWILLTICTIIRPAYSLTRQRNGQRLFGTFAGGLLGFLCMYFLEDNYNSLFIIMLISMVISYTFLRLQYFIFTTALTLYVMLSFYFLNPIGFTTLLSDRLIDTGIGSVIAFLVSLFVLPTWERQQMTKYIKDALMSNKIYFDTVAIAFIEGRRIDITKFKLARKDSFVALANVSDNLQRMLSEPKDKQKKLLHYHQFVASTHLLTSHIAALSYYAQYKAKQYAFPGFKMLIEDVDHRFETALTLLGDKSEYTINQHLIRADIYQLFEEQRKASIAKSDNRENSEIENKFSDLHSIIHQFELINMLAADEVRILKKLKLNS